MFLRRARLNTESICPSSLSSGWLGLCLQNRHLLTSTSTLFLPLRTCRTERLYHVFLNLTDAQLTCQYKEEWRLTQTCSVRVISASQSCSFSFNKSGLFSVENTFLLKRGCADNEGIAAEFTKHRDIFLSVLTWHAAADAASYAAVEVNSTAAARLCPVVGFTGNFLQMVVCLCLCVQLELNPLTAL